MYSFLLCVYSCRQLADVGGKSSADSCGTFCRTSVCPPFLKINIAKAGADQRHKIFLAEYMFSDIIYANFIFQATTLQQITKFTAEDLYIFYSHSPSLQK